MGQIRLPPSPLRYKGTFFGKEALTAEDGKDGEVSNKFEARYILYAQASGEKVVRMPERQVGFSRAVKTWAQYLRDLRQRLYETYHKSTLDPSGAERFVEEVSRRFSSPDPLEHS